ncbi:MAG: hypothetical protein ACKO7N_02050 [Candidatus Nitrosotenuis sp.]
MKVKSTYIAGIVGIIIITLSVFFLYSSDQAKNRGKIFGDQLQVIQDELKQTQDEFYSKKSLFDEKAIAREEFATIGQEHIKKMNQILAKYDTLLPPDSFAKAVKLFKTSTEKQIESDQYLIDWIMTNNTSQKVRSDELLQESFENEMAGLTSYNQAKNNAG